MFNMNENKEKIVVRFPPSPTGRLHIGNIRSLLFNYLFARKHNGKIVMRFEDTDRERSKKEYEELALNTLEKLGLEFDSGPFRQSERGERYFEIIEQLVADDKAYEAEESKDGSGDKVIRLRNQNKDVTFTDVVRGEITIDTTDFGDFVIARSKTNPFYHLTVVVDDMDMGITHVIRGEDHITSTPRQILIIEAIAGKIPQYAHLPLIVGDDKKKLGKRHGAVTYQEFEALGILPEAIINYLALLGWNPGDEREFFTKEELVKEFSLERVNNSPAKFSYEKLDSINRHHILKLDAAIFDKRVLEFLPTWLIDTLDENKKDILIQQVIKERISKFADIKTMEEEGEFNYLRESINYDKSELIWKKGVAEDAQRHLAKVKDMIQDLDDDKFNPEDLKNTIWDYASEEGRGDVLWPLRMALTGQKRSPDPFTVMSLLGKIKVLQRIEDAF